MAAEYTSALRKMWNTAPIVGIDAEGGLKGELLGSIRNETREAPPLCEKLMMNPVQLQHYHLLLCLEQLIVRFQTLLLVI